MEYSSLAEVIWSVIIAGLCGLLIRVFDVIWYKPRRMRSTLSKQGIGGPKPSLFLGNISQMQNIQSAIQTKKSPSSPAVFHDWSHSIFPYLHQWAHQYGRVFMYSTGNMQHLYVGNVELIKELNLYKSLNIGRPTYLAKATEAMLGDGVIRANGTFWAHQRKLIAPEFFQHRVKRMLGLMEECTISLMKNWESVVESKGVAELSIDQDLSTLSADIISKACFGSSYSQGKQIFAKLEALQETMSKPSVLFGLNLFRFLPTKNNRRTWMLQKEVESLILEVIKSRQQDNNKSSLKDEEKDLLQTLLENATNDKDGLKYDANRFVVDNCKNIYFAGNETTSITASWTLMLLALHPEWQQRVREEIFDICGHHKSHHAFLDWDKLRQLKMLTMVLHETLRLYSPAVLTSREALGELRIGELIVPKGVHIWVSFQALHRDTENWGADANEFKPERFANGVSEACKYPHAYMPFGFGSRMCIGQAFSMLELKVVLCHLISKFSFELSPQYRHSPVYKMLLKPEHGIQLLITSCKGSSS